MKNVTDQESGGGITWRAIVYKSYKSNIKVKKLQNHHKLVTGDRTVSTSNLARICFVTVRFKFTGSHKPETEEMAGMVSLSPASNDQIG